MQDKDNEGTGAQPRFRRTVRTRRVFSSRFFSLDAGKGATRKFTVAFEDFWRARCTRQQRVRACVQQSNASLNLRFARPAINRGRKQQRAMRTQETRRDIKGC